MYLKSVTLIVPYYRNRKMLDEQLKTWEQYPQGYEIILVDDGSSEPAADIVSEFKPELSAGLKIYRIDVDIPWNRGGARNLGTQEADTDWIIHIDIDHILPSPAAWELLSLPVSHKHWYRFPRYRIGKADETRRKDAIPDNQETGPIKPHIDSYLCTRSMYWDAGGYNEDFSGCLGGGSPFLAEMTKLSEPALLPEDVYLNVYTRHRVEDASVNTLSRETGEFARRKRSMNGYKGSNPIRFPWHRVL